MSLFDVGLEKIRALITSGFTELKVVITDWDGTQKFAQYQNFTIGAKYDNYRMGIANYSGTAGKTQKFNESIV